MSLPAPWTGPENDYRGIAELPAATEPTVTVIIPVYNRTTALIRTLAGLAGQSHQPDETIVADDGSTEDVSAAVAAAAIDLNLRVLTQQRDGFGAGRARNMGAAATGSDVLVFLDSDCVPDADLISRHLFWHERASNVVVAGTRVDLGPAGVATPDAPGWDGSAVPGSLVPADWRRLVYRRSKLLTIGDDAYRAGLSSNLSVRRDRFEAVGGFSAAFTTWGGEDTELSWRLWNSGMFVVPENRAIVRHQREEDELGVEGRAEARRRAVELVADLVPHRFYRKIASPFYTVPKVTWIGRAADSGEVARLWRELSQATFADAEIVMLAPPHATDHLRSQAANSPRLTLIDSATGLGTALTAARGELVALIDGRSRIDRRLMLKAVMRLERDPRAGVVRCAYRLAGNQQYRRLDDLLSLDLEHGRDGFPFFAVGRRRELLKDARLLTSPADLWRETLRRNRTELLINDHAGIELAGPESPGMPRPADLIAAGPREVGRLGIRAGRALRRRGAKPEPVSKPEHHDKIRIDYIGFTGKDNLGDEAVLAGVRKLLPWAELGRDLSNPQVLMVGGGTLINGKNYYLTRVLRNDSPHLERVMFGTGVRSPEFWGTTENVSEWWSFMHSAIYAGVRGPDSVRYLENLGYRGKPDILGDPALALTAPPGAHRVDGRVIICPVHTTGSLWGEDDAAVFAALADSAKRLRAKGHEVVMMSLFPADDRWLIEMMREAGAPGMPYVAGYADLDTTLTWLASADLVVSERLHGSILAAACGTPFVALEYRPKVRDFARSINLEDVVVRTDAVDQLDETIDRVLRERDDFRDRIVREVAAIRTHQEAVATDLQVRLQEALA